MDPIAALNPEIYIIEPTGFYQDIGATTVCDEDGEPIGHAQNHGTGMPLVQTQDSGPDLRPELEAADDDFIGSFKTTFVSANVQRLDGGDQCAFDRTQPFCWGMVLEAVTQISGFGTVCGRLHDPRVGEHYLVLDSDNYLYFTQIKDLPGSATYAQIVTDDPLPEACVVQAFNDSTGDASGMEIWVNGAPVATSVLSDTLPAILTGIVEDASNAEPIVVTTTGHELTTGDVVEVTDVGGNDAANGRRQVNVLDPDTFELVGSSGNSAYTGGGTWKRLDTIALDSVVAVGSHFEGGGPYAMDGSIRRLHAIQADLTTEQREAIAEYLGGAGAGVPAGGIILLTRR